MITDSEKKYIEDLTEGELEDCVRKCILPDESPFTLSKAMLEYAGLVYSCKLKMQHMGWGS